MVEHWNSDLIIGDLIEGIAMGYNPPLTGPLFYLGYLEFTAWEPIEDDYYFYVTATINSGVLIVVDDQFNTHAVNGGGYTFNCSDTAGCNYYCGWHGYIALWTEPDAINCYQDIEVFTTPVEESSFSAVKSLY